MLMEKRYSAQALAITMIVLVVSAIIGLSIYSRISRDKRLTVDERASAEALEISDLVVEKLSGYEADEILDGVVKLGKTMTYPSGVSVKESRDTDEISALFRILGTENIFETVGFCLPSQGNEYNLVVKEAEASSPYEVPAGQIWSLPIGNANLSGCNLMIQVSKGDTRSGFSITKLYAKDYDATGKAGEYKRYGDNDVTNYCFSDNGTECNDKDSLLDTWVLYSPSSPINISLSEVVDGYKLDTVIVRAVGGNIGVYYNMANSTGDSCMDGFRMIELRASAYCNGIYRGKEILIPQKKWHSPIFDYAIFNAEGAL